MKRVLFTLILALSLSFSAQAQLTCEGVHEQSVSDCNDAFGLTFLQSWGINRLD